MNIPLCMYQAFYHSCDAIFRLAPQPRPSLEKLHLTKIIAHRGAHHHDNIWENTLAAFARARDCGVAGLELDLRWTKDLIPVVIHDADPQRVFGISLQIAAISMAELRQQIPQIPTVAEVVAQFGKQLHLMIELKQEHYPDPTIQATRLLEILLVLKPQQDYHLMSLTPEIFTKLPRLPTAACLPIAQVSVRAFSNLAVEQHYAGIAGHYLLLRDSIIKRHLLRGELIGTGQVASKNCLYREINRGVEWIFSDNACTIQAYLNQAIADS